MAKTVSEKVGLRSIRSVRVEKRRAPGVSFYALEASLCVVIEADSEDDARHLCRDVRLEFVGLCER